MPNHISNLLTIHAPDDRVAQVLSEILSTAGLMDFGKLIPQPDDLYQGDLSIEDRDATKGHNWLDWNIANWGTKWGAYNNDRRSANSVYFDTAWSTPEPIWSALHEKYPDIRFSAEYADEDKGSNAGVFVFSLDYSVHMPYKGKEAIKLWFKLNPGSDPSEYGYNEDFEYVSEDD